ncbi:MAG: GGDEF domain-containing response regulator [Myxococcales bacterium]|nr:GGDEF domain-containing response regulator [Myxococcales bacterium]
MTPVAQGATILLYMVDQGERVALQSRLESSDVNVRAIAGSEDIAALPAEHGAAPCFVEVRDGDESGLRIIRKLREAGFTRNIVVLSSNRDMECRMAARDAGADDYLATPIRNIDLQMRLARCLGAEVPPLPADGPAPPADGPAPPADGPAPPVDDPAVEVDTQATVLALEEARASTRAAHDEVDLMRRAVEAARLEIEFARADAQGARALAESKVQEMLENERRTRQLQSQAHTLIEVAEARQMASHREPARVPSVSGEERKSDVDELTRLLGPGPLQEHLDREYARSRRYGHALSVLFVDVDAFARYCKRHGSDAGDSALCLVADVLRAALRVPDIVARPGSDTFAILATDTSEEEALLLGNRLRQELAMESRHGSWPAVTVSIGIASAERISVSRASDLLEAASRAMSEAKKNGRDRCCIAMES